MIKALIIAALLMLCITPASISGDGDNQNAGQSNGTSVSDNIPIVASDAPPKRKRPKVSTVNSDSIVATIELNPLDALRRFNNRDALHIARELTLMGNADFRKLQERSGLDAQVLNRHLRELKSAQLVLQDEDLKTYSLSKYGRELLDFVNSIRKRLKDIPSDKLLSPDLTSPMQNDNP